MTSTDAARSPWHAALLSELRGDSSGLPAGDWRLWVADSHVIRDRAAFLARTLFATFMCTVLFGYLLQFSQSHPARFWFIYLTNWTLSVQCAYLSLAVYATWRAGQAAPPGAATSPLPRFVRALLALQGVALPGSFLVTLLFWTLVLPTIPEAAQYTVNYLVHGANAAVMAADVALSAQPFPLRLCGGLLPYGALYILWTVVYYAAGGLNEWGQPWIYVPIYWGSRASARAGAALCAALLAAGAPALILACWAAVRARDAWAAAGGNSSGGTSTASTSIASAGTPRREALRMGLLPLLDARGGAGGGEEEEEEEAGCDEEAVDAPGDAEGRELLPRRDARAPAEAPPPWPGDAAAAAAAQEEQQQLLL